MKEPLRYKKLRTLSQKGNNKWRSKRVFRLRKKLTWNQLMLRRSILKRWVNPRSRKRSFPISLTRSEQPKRGNKQRKRRRTRRKTPKSTGQHDFSYLSFGKIKFTISSRAFFLNDIRPVFLILLLTDKHIFEWLQGAENWGTDVRRTAVGNFVRKTCFECSCLSVENLLKFFLHSLLEAV